MNQRCKTGKNISIQTVFAFLLLVSFGQPLFADGYLENISEDYLRTQFEFKPDEKLKYSQCEEKSYSTCTYVWGIESKKDATRINLGLAPKGSKLQITYAQAKNQKDFQRVTASYSDAEKIDGLAEEAVWSEARMQLSLITDKNLIVHVNIDQVDSNNQRAKAISIARDLLKRL